MSHVGSQLTSMIPPTIVNRMGTGRAFLPLSFRRATLFGHHQAFLPHLSIYSGILILIEAFCLVGVPPSEAMGQLVPARVTSLEILLLALR